MAGLSVVTAFYFVHRSHLFPFSRGVGTLTFIAGKIFIKTLRPSLSRLP